MSIVPEQGNLSSILSSYHFPSNRINNFLRIVVVTIQFPLKVGLHCSIVLSQFYQLIIIASYSIDSDLLSHYVQLFFNLICVNIQVKECTSALLRFAKRTNIPVLLVRLPRM